MALLNIKSHMGAHRTQTGESGHNHLSNKMVIQNIISMKATIAIKTVIDIKKIGTIVTETVTGIVTMTLIVIITMSLIVEAAVTMILTVGIMILMSPGVVITMSPVAETVIIMNQTIEVKGINQKPIQSLKIRIQMHELSTIAQLTKVARTIGMEKGKALGGIGTGPEARDYEGQKGTIRKKNNMPTATCNTGMKRQRECLSQTIQVQNLGASKQQ